MASTRIPRSGLFQNFHLPRKDVRITGGQSDFFDGLHGVSGGQVEWIACSHVAKNADLKFPVVALQARRPGAAPDAGDIFKTHLAQFVDRGPSCAPEHRDYRAAPAAIAW